MHIRRISTLLTAVATISIFSAFSFKAANFSGTWKLNEGKSELGQFGTRGAATKIVIEQTAEAFKLVRTTNGFDGNAMDVTENHVIGKESENEGFANSKKISTLNWETGEQSFKIIFLLKLDFQGQSMELKGNEKWEISTDGNTITINSTIATPQGDFSTKAVYDKG